MMRFFAAMAFLVLLMGYRAMACGDEAESWQVRPLGFMGFQVLEDGQPLFGFEGKVLGPGWRPPRMECRPEPSGDCRVYQETVSFYTWLRDEERPDDCLQMTELGKPVHIRHEAKSPRVGVLELSYVLTAREEAPLTGMMLFMPISSTLRGGQGQAVKAGGGSTDFPVPPPQGPGGVGSEVSKVILRAPSGATATLEFDDPCAVNYHHGELRLWLYEGGLAAGQNVRRSVTVTFSRPARVSLESPFLDMRDWLPLQMDNDNAPGSAVGVADWLDAPAGSHGWLTMDGDRFVFQDGTPVKFWGFNICNTKVAPHREAADTWAARCAKYGVNIVRLHKFIGRRLMGIMSEDDLTQVNEEKARRFDYFHAALKERGVYVGWSPIWRYHVLPADRDRLLAYEEVLHARESGLFKGTPCGLATLFPDIQDLYIRATLGMLNRVNTVTGLRYAEDPMIAYVELQNEDNAFLPDYGRLLENCPTYQREINRRFSDWLAERYGTHSALTRAWGEDIEQDEEIGPGRAVQFPGNGSDTDLTSRRVLDTHRFLYEVQSAYYRRYVEAIRETGYRGIIVGSCWQARTWLGHLYNVLSDREVGYIDRHNYGGVNMIGRPGSGLLSAGMQVVSDRPFGLSEWGAASLWGSGDAAAIICTYGMGLGGWDLSAQFASSSPLIEGEREGHRGCDLIVNMAQHPRHAGGPHRFPGGLQSPGRCEHQGVLLGGAPGLPCRRARGAGVRRRSR